MNLRWSENAVGNLKEIIDYLENISEKKADELLDEAILFAQGFTPMPYRYPECQEIPTKSKMYHSALFLKHYRFIYRIQKEEIVVLGIIHTSRNPDTIKKLKDIE